MISQHEVEIPVGANKLEGILSVPENALGLVIFAHGSGSGRFSPRNLEVARILNEHRIATLLFDLLTASEEEADDRNAKHRFNISLLAHRLVIATRWARRQPACGDLKIGYFGASTGAAAAIVAAVEMPESVCAVVSRGGRTDLAGLGALHELRAPTLLLIGSEDHDIVRINRKSAREIRGPHKVELIEGATHLFEERDSLQQAAVEAAKWFLASFPINRLSESSGDRARDRMASSMKAM
jgi:putative phosphoribosyl transferase